MSPFGSRISAGIPREERLLEQHDAEPGLAGARHADDDGVRRQVGRVEEKLAAAFAQLAEMEPLLSHLREPILLRSFPRTGEARRRPATETARMRLLTTDRFFVLTAMVIYTAVFSAFLLLERPGIGIANFYYLAIALMALSYGPLWGAFAGALATALYAAGVALNHDLPTSELFTISAPVRLVNYIAIGALLGWFAAHYRVANRELQILAQRDFLTGLPNTRAFELAIDRRLAAKEPFALLVGDVDAQAGEDRDEALRRVSDVLLRVLEANIDVARVGGDEFAVLAPCWSVEEAGQLAARLERVLCEDGSLVTFGWSAFPREGENALTLYRAADERLYARRILRQPRTAAVHLVGV